MKIAVTLTVRLMQIIGVQLDSIWEDPAGNCARAWQMLSAARVEPGAIIVLPEMFASGFVMDPVSATSGHERTIDELTRWASTLHAYVLAGVAMPTATGHAENRAVMVGPDGKIVDSYTKLHPFRLVAEHDHFQPGRQILTFACGPFTVAPFICYDLRFPEIFRHSAIRRGADLLIVIANWPISRAEHWQTLLRARAIENQSYVIGVNRVGRDPSTLYGGRSVVVDPMGVVRADAGDAETLLIADLDPAVVEQTRRRFPFLNDRRDDFLR